MKAIFFISGTNSSSTTGYTKSIFAFSIFSIFLYFLFIFISYYYIFNDFYNVFFSQERTEARQPHVPEGAPHGLHGRCHQAPAPGTVRDQEKHQGPEGQDIEAVVHLRGNVSTDGWCLQFFFFRVDSLGKKVI